MSAKNALTVVEAVIAGVIFIFVLYVTIPAVSMTRPNTVAIKYVSMYIKLQENALKVINNADYEEHYSPFKLAAVPGNEMCEHISQQFDTKGEIKCNGEGNANNPNFHVFNKTSWWGLGGEDFKIPTENIINNCNDPKSEYKCYKTIYVDLNGYAGVNKEDIDVYKIRLRFDGKVDTLPEWTAENIFLETL